MIFAVPYVRASTDNKGQDRTRQVRVIELWATREGGNPARCRGRRALPLHEESSWMAAQARAIAIGRSCDLINDAVGSNRGKYLDLIRKLTVNAYEITVVCVYVLDVEVLIGRAAYRAKKDGRVVPLEFIQAAHAQIPSVFNHVREVVPQWFVLNGETGAVVWQQVNDIPSVQDAEFVSKFRGTAP